MPLFECAAGSPEGPTPPFASPLGILAEEARCALSRQVTHARDEALHTTFLRKRAALAGALLTEACPPAATAVLSAVIAIARKSWSSGIHDLEPSANDLDMARTGAREGGCGLLAAMLLVPAFRLPEAPPMAEAPTWLTSAYATWMFSTPQMMLYPGAVSTFCEHVRNKQAEIASILRSERSSLLAREVLAAYLNAFSGQFAFMHRGDAREHARLRAEIISSALTLSGETPASFVPPRNADRIRIGIVARQFSPHGEIYTTIPIFEALDSSRFEVRLYALTDTHSPLEIYCRNHCADFQILPKDSHDQVELLVASELDVLVYASNLTAVCNEIVTLALHRIAPLQIATNSSPITTGLPEVDLYISGRLNEEDLSGSQYSERLALLPGPAHAFNYAVDKVGPLAPCSRSKYAIPNDSVLLVNAAPFFKILPEMMDGWALILESNPSTHLLLHPFNQTWQSGSSIEAFSKALERAFAGRGVSPKRFTVSSSALPSRADVKALIGLGDIYLGVFPFSDTNALIDPLENGTPTVVWEGSTFRSRAGSALLRSIGLSDMIAGKRDEYVTIVSRLITDLGYRESVRSRITLAMHAEPVFLDSLAASDGFASIVEMALKELHQGGREAFRSNPDPLRATLAEDPGIILQAGSRALEAGQGDEAMGLARSVLAITPNDPVARAILGRALMKRGNLERSVDYFLAAIQQLPNDANLWFDFSQALGRSGRTAPALQALERSLRLDSTHRERWRAMADLASLAGSPELLEGALRMLGPNPGTEDLAASA